MMKKGVKRSAAAVLILALVAVTLYLIIRGAGAERRDGSVGAQTMDQTRYATVGTGSVGGVYFQFGRALARIVNETTQETGLQLEARPTGASIYNINSILNGGLEFGLAQADRLHDAYYGNGDWAGTGPRQTLRTVCSLYCESVTLLAAADEGIETVHDLKGRRVNLGNPGSGHRGNAIDVLDAAGLNWRQDLYALGFRIEKAVRLFHEGGLDALFYTVGHPAEIVKQAAEGLRPVKLIPILPNTRLNETCPWFSAAIIPAETYPNLSNQDDISTVALRTVLITSQDVPDDAVYTITAAIFENLARIRARHPAFEKLDPAIMTTQALHAPLHSGAARYFEANGLMD